MAEENDFLQFYANKSKAEFDMFSTQEMRDAEKIGQLKEVYISELRAFKNHTFKVIDNEEMETLKESIAENGIIQPLIVFVNEDNELEIISGHRRKRACELLGQETVPVMIKEMTRDEAIIAMGETNLKSREHILPSEKGFTYKAMLEAMSRQGKRTDKLVDSGSTERRSNIELGKKVNESKTSIQRFIAITKLKKILLDFVDDGRIGLTTAVELSYLNENFQDFVADVCIQEEKFPSYAQARELRALQKENKLDEEKISDILLEEKPNQKEGFRIADKEINELLKNCISVESRVDRIKRALRLLDEQEAKLGASRDEEYER